ncbi:MAG: glutamate--tRNA ligase [Bacteroidales bacterium]|jgi:glutamyl-tRNA synthetase|nr:glutamate--tRNA ligase [Bacteroidales bacterium]
MENIRTRFAPSPTGFMHIGNLRTSLYAYLFAKKNSGKFILRIEDTDRERIVPQALETIYNTLKLAGLTHDEGPDIGGNYSPYIQSERKTIYAQYAEELIKKGKAYYCFCTKERIEGLTDSSGNRRYDKHCLHLSQKEIAAHLASGIPYIIRQNVPVEGVSSFSDLVYGDISVENKELYDNVLIKSDGFPTYNFANVVDDHLMQISHVFRGMEYLSSTPNYNLLYQDLGWEIPQYVHLPHIMRDKQHKLSKRDGDANFEDFLAKGFLADAIINYVALLGWNPKNDREKFTFAELVEAFNIDGISKSPAVFDEIKLRWLNAQYIKEMSAEDFHLLATPCYVNITTPVDQWFLSKLIQSRIMVLSDIEETVKFIDHFENYDLNLLENKNAKSTLELAKTVLPIVINEFQKIVDWDNELLYHVLEQISEQYQLKRRPLMWIVRIAVTGHASTPCGATEACVLLQKELSINRMRYSLEKITNN